VIHPYGQVGYLPWQRSDPVISYGNTEGNLRTIADEILTFTESENCGVTNEVKHLIETAETAVILGFGFLPQNVQLLAARTTSSVRRIFFTTKGVGPSDVELVERDISIIFNNHKRNGNGGLSNALAFDSYHEPEGCSDLMDHHWMRLTRAI
jgi:hypothetical protein